MRFFCRRDGNFFQREIGNHVLRYVCRRLRCGRSDGSKDRPLIIILRRSGLHRIFLLRGHAGAVKSGRQLLHAADPVRIPQRHALAQYFLLGPRDLCPARRRRQQTVTHQPVERIFRRPARDQFVDRRAHGIDVCPGSLGRTGVILLRRRKARLEHDRQALFALTADLPCRAEINQLDQPAFDPDQIGRADIPVDQSLLMHSLKRLHHRPQHPIGLIKGQGPMLFDIFPQALPLQILHDDISRLVFLEKVSHRHDILVILISRKDPGLLQEFYFSLFKPFPVLRAAGLHIQRLCDIAASGAGGIIFFYGYRNIQGLIIAPVGDPETALSEHFQNLIASP